MRGNRLFSVIAVGAGMALAACGGSEVTVQVLREGPDGPAPEPNLSVFFYPFDRDSVFDQLDREATSPKPEVPAQVLATDEQIRSLQEEWRLKEAEWSETRDRLQTLSDEMNAMDARARGTRQYMSRYEEFEQLEGVERRLNSEKESLFNQFTALQETITTQIDSFRAVRDSWEEDAYAGYYDIEDELLTALGRQVYEDTTNADGYVTRALPGGDWWVRSRVRVPRGEFVWDTLIDPSQVDTLRLDPTNGTERIRF